MREIKLEQISYQELLIEVREIYNLLHKLTNSDVKISSFLSTTLIPYISFVCDGLEYFHAETKEVNSSWYNKTRGHTVQKLIKETRNALKLYSDKRNKVIPELEDDIDLFYGYCFVFMEELNLHLEIHRRTVSLSKISCLRKFLYNRSQNRIQSFKKLINSLVDTSVTAFRDFMVRLPPSPPIHMLVVFFCV